MKIFNKLYYFNRGIFVLNRDNVIRLCYFLGTVAKIIWYIVRIIIILDE